MFTSQDRPRGNDFKALPAYSLYVTILTSEDSVEKLAKEIKRPVKDVELMEKQLLNEWVHCDTGDYFDDLPKGPDWLYEVVSVRTEEISNRMHKIWDKIVKERLEKK
jgi:hypothetical protein